MSDIRNIHNILVEKFQGKRPFGRLHPDGKMLLTLILKK
jgi:hypothetical protein